jgi:predicted amidohydrolase
MRAAAVQMNSNAERERNLANAVTLVRAAAADGATLVVLPERFDVRGDTADYERAAEPLRSSRTAAWASDLARELGIDLIAGSTSERREGRDKPSNTSLHLGPDGELKAAYRKVHLFDVTVGDTEYRESDSDEAGDELVVTEAGDGTPIGLSVCYDVRFPELYRILALNGALVLTVPANFTRTTGEAHWELLLRARAVENQAFVVAAAQAGEYPPGMPAYGNAMIVDPWGEVLARASGDGDTFVAADLDFARLAEVREKLPSLQNRVPGAYRWPEPGGPGAPARTEAHA